MPFGCGRKSAPEWLEVIQLECQSKVKCKNCGMEISAKIERIRSHLKNCLKHCIPISSTSSSANANKEIGELLDTSSVNLCEKRKIETNPTQSSNVTVGVNLKRQRTLMDFTVRTTERQKYELDMKVAKFFYANNIAFNAASSHEYIEMFKAMRPGYCGPSRNDLGGKLLEAVNSEVDEKMKKELQEKESTATLLLDGWSNIQNEAIIGTCLHTGTKSFFLKAVDCEANKKTSDYCAEIAKSSISFCKEVLDVDIFSVCTDNENKMLKMREILQNQHEGLITYGCSAHYLHLLAEEITNKDILKHVVEVQKFFRNHNQPHGYLREKNGCIPQLPSTTRWNSHLACVNTFTKNYQKYTEIISEHPEDIPQNICRKLENITIYKEALHMQRQLTEVGKILDKMQSENITISDAVELWLDLLKCTTLVPYCNNIKKRMDQALLPIHFLANIMNPKYSGRRLSVGQEQLAEEWLMSNHPEWLVHFIAYKAKDSDIYPRSVFVKDVIENFTMAKWWNILRIHSEKSEKLPEAFCKFMIGLSNCPASTASIERIFSTCGLVWSKLRNRLGIEKAEKLVKIHKHLHNTENE